jgi:hypothetical protein
MERNPDLAPYVEDDPDKLPKFASEAELRAAEAAQPNFTPLEWTMLLGRPLYNLIQDDEPLPDVAQRRLDELGVSQEQVLLP